MKKIKDRTKLYGKDYKHYNDKYYYNLVDGYLYWKTPPKNKVKKKFDMVGGNNAISDYKRIGFSINGKNYSIEAHIMIWFMHYGFLPENSIDHIDRDTSNNRWFNLREATMQCQARNRGMCSNNTSGVTGVTFNKVCKKWVSAIGGSTSYVYLFLGKHLDLEDAICARYAGEQCLDYHRGIDQPSSAKQYILDNINPNCN